ATQDLLLQIAAQDERIRISRDMHDVIGHGLTGLSIQTELLTLETTGNLKEKLQLLHDNARQLLADVRETVSFIRQPRNYDLKSILTRMVEGILKPSARLEMNNVNINQPHHAEALLRCVQEGTTNAIRHSKAETILISLTGCSEAIQLIIRDDGCGMETDECKFGNGLNGIRERISALNGEFKLYSRKNQGTTIDITLPLRAEL
ncbi:MAG: sensor histidine kinase, partial [Gammaproteobacteria bacterium]|nr:sensor histidine kinase [Gammaproteobacteria bacterium]